MGPWNWTQVDNVFPCPVSRLFQIIQLVGSIWSCSFRNHRHPFGRTGRPLKGGEVPWKPNFEGVWVKRSSWCGMHDPECAGQGEKTSCFGRLVVANSGPPWPHAADWATLSCSCRWSSCTDRQLAWRKKLLVLQNDILVPENTLVQCDTHVGDSVSPAIACEKTCICRAVCCSVQPTVVIDRELITADLSNFSARCSHRLCGNWCV